MPAEYSSLEANALEAFASAVRAERKKRGISQEGLAALAGINRGYMGHIERGSQNPTLLLMLRISVALDIPLAELVAVSGL